MQEIFHQNLANLLLLVGKHDLVLLFRNYWKISVQSLFKYWKWLCNLVSHYLKQLCNLVSHYWKGNGMALESQYLNSHTIHHPCRRFDLGGFLKILNYTIIVKCSNTLHNLFPRLVARWVSGLVSDLSRRGKFWQTLFLCFLLQICKQIDKRMSCFDILASMSVPCFKLSLVVIFVSRPYLVHFTLPVLNLRLPAQTNKLVVE